MACPYCQEDATQQLERICQNSEHMLLTPYNLLQDSGQKRLDLKSRPALLATPMLLCEAVF